MDATYYMGDPPDDGAWDLRPDEEHCPDCGAAPDDPCEVLCSCPHCEKERQRRTHDTEVA